MDEGAVGVTNLSTVISVMDENASAPLLDPEQGNGVGSVPLQGNRVFYRVKHKHWACAHENNNSTEEGMQEKKKKLTAGLDFRSGLNIFLLNILLSAQPWLEFNYLCH